jgi:hypothetical protein
MRSTAADVIAGLVQHHTGIMQRDRIAGMLGKDRRVACERLAQPALPMEVERFIERRGELHRALFAGSQYTEPDTVTVTAFLPPSVGTGGG